MTTLTEDKELEKIRESKMKEMVKKSQQTVGVVKLSSSTFDNFLKETDLPVIVDFWADWCMPCRIMAPVMKDLAQEFEGKALFAKVNVDENPDVASRYRIMSIPHFLIFKNGTLAEKIVGAVGRDPLANAINKYL